jgi:segregation and condensation protein B
MGKKKTSVKKTTQDLEQETSLETALEIAADKLVINTSEIVPSEEIEKPTGLNVIVKDGTIKAEVETPIQSEEEKIENLDDIDNTIELDELAELDNADIEDVENLEGMDDKEIPEVVNADSVTEPILRSKDQTTSKFIEPENQEKMNNIDQEAESATEIEKETPTEEITQKVDEESILKEGVAEIVKENASSEKQGIATNESVKTVTFKELAESTTKKTWVEAAMFIAGRPVSVEELGIKLELKKKEVEDLINELASEYMDRQTSIEIVQVGDKFSMQIKPEYTEKVKAFTSGGLIPEAVMRTLTIIALKQPISKSMVIKMRGASAYEHIKFLVDRGFVETYKKGRSSDLSTTDQFSDTFGLSRDHKKLKQQLIEQLGVAPAVSSDADEVSDNAVPKQAEQ